MCENFMFAQEYAFAKRCCFLPFSFEGKLKKDMIFPWNGNIRKLMKIWHFLSFSQIFVRQKFFFSCSVSDLTTKTALTAVKNKIPVVSSLVKKANYDTKNSELEKKLIDHVCDKYIATPEFNTLAADVINARLAQEFWIAKTDFDAKLLSFNKKSERFACWQRIEKAKNIWFKLFYWQKSFLRRWYTKLFIISGNVQMF